MSARNRQNRMIDEYKATTGLLASSGGRETGRVTWPLMFTAMVSSMASAQNGWNIGVLNLPQNQIVSDLRLSTSVFAQMSIAHIIAIFCVGGWIGSFSGGLIDSLGRKSFLRLNHLTFIVGGALCVGIEYLKHSDIVASYILFMFARLLFGIGAGMGSVVVPLFLGEISTPENRGIFSGINQLQVVLWILVSQLIGLGMKTSATWAWLMFISGALSSVALVFTNFIEESPQWLIAQGRRSEAAETLVRLRGYQLSSADDELVEIEAALANAKSSAEKVSIVDVVKNPIYKKPLLVACVLQVTQQFSGINAVMFYSTAFFQKAVPSNPQIGIIGTLAMGAVNLVSTAVSLPLIEKAGRRPLILTAIGGMLACAFALTGFLVGGENNPTLEQPFSNISIFIICLYVTFFELGLGAIPWSIGGELFPEGPKATAMSIAAAFNWLCNTIVALFFSELQLQIGNYSFIPFGCWLSLAFVFAVIMVPETKGRTPAELLAWFNKGYGPTKDSYP